MAIYMDWTAIHINEVTPAPDRTFHVDEVWNYWYMQETTLNYTALDFSSIPSGGWDTIEADQRIDILDTDAEISQHDSLDCVRPLVMEKFMSKAFIERVNKVE